ncbi:tetratricopeptide repeat protein, partial [Pyxidicoccus sp. 3LFB2]
GRGLGALHAGRAAARSGDTARAEKLFVRTLAMDPKDAYTRAAYADLLLDLGRPREAATLVRGHTGDDNQLLRLVLAETALGSPEAQVLSAELSERYAASRLRGDGLHAREEARFALQVEKAPQKALTLAQAAWEAQREPWDVRLLLEAALAAGRPEAAAPALQFLKASGTEDPVVLELASRVRRSLP